MTERVDAKAVLALQVYEIKSEHMEWCHACLRWTVDGHSDTCLAGALAQTLGLLAEAEKARQQALKWALVCRVVWRLSRIGLPDGVYAGELEGVGYKLVYDTAEHELRFGHGAYLPDEEDWLMDHAEVAALAPARETPDAPKEAT